MKNCLLIDDLALKGWKSIIEKAITKTDQSIEVASSFEEAIEKIENKYDLIFLDVRLTEEDHKVNIISDYSGFKILKEIKKDFLKINYSTPIILITASNKIWNIDEFRDYGVDAYYIKEHPDYIFSKENSLFNLKNLQDNYLNLIQVGEKRNEVWEICNNVINLINNHPYFRNGDLKYLNIKGRIIDKLKLGYSLLFQKQTKLQEELHLSNNETLSFLVFWSILEEISKAFTDISATWDNHFNRSGNWKFRNKEYFIEFNRNKEEYKINYESWSGNINVLTKDQRWHNGVINLSDQICSLIWAYEENRDRSITIQSFKEINKYRNEVDYIHSSVNNIINKKLIDIGSNIKAYEMNVKILILILKLFSIKDKL